MGTIADNVARVRERIAALAMGFEQRERRPIATIFFCVTLLGLTLPLERGTSLVLLYEGSAAALAGYGHHWH